MRICDNHASDQVGLVCEFDNGASPSRGITCISIRYVHHHNCIVFLLSQSSLLASILECSLILINQAYCLGVYDVALWKVFTQESINKFQACYNRCIKMFFGFSRRYSTTQLLIDTGLPSFSTVLHNSRCIFNKSWFACDNAVVAHLRELTVVLP